MRTAAGTADTVSTITRPKLEATGAIDPGVFADPVRVPVFAERFVHAGDRRPVEAADFSGVPDRVARVIATLRLSEPEVGYDHWDKKGSVRLRVEDARHQGDVAEHPPHEGVHQLEGRDIDENTARLGRRDAVGQVFLKLQGQLVVHVDLDGD